MENYVRYNTSFKLLDNTIIKKFSEKSKCNYFVNTKIKLDDSDDYFFILKIEESYYFTQPQRTYSEIKLYILSEQDIYSSKYLKVHVQDIFVELDYKSHKLGMEQLIQNKIFESKIAKIMSIFAKTLGGSLLLLFILIPFLGHNNKNSLLMLLVYIFVISGFILFSTFIFVLLHGLFFPDYNEKQYKPTKLLETEYTRKLLNFH